jgi:hypothetical protein
MAVKWIGNAGSHASVVTFDDALDGYELMDWVLDALYARRHRRAAIVALSPLSPVDARTLHRLALSA